MAKKCTSKAKGIRGEEDLAPQLDGGRRKAARAVVHFGGERILHVGCSHDRIGRSESIGIGGEYLALRFLCPQGLYEVHESLFVNGVSQSGILALWMIEETGGHILEACFELERC